MLESNVLHQSRSGPRGDGDVVGISWKAPTRSHPSPSLVVTCAHQVVVYMPGEERRTHQWSFKPSAATVLSHAAVFLPAASRYVGVQQGSALVSWRESEQDVKRPLSSQAAGPVHAVHACPQLGDYFVAVLAVGAVSLYQGGLQRVAHCDAAGGGNGSAGARSKVVWSGVRGNKVIILENIGAASDRITTFALTVKEGASRSSSSSRRTDASGAGGGGGSAAAVVAAPASVALVSSLVLTKPSLATLGGGEDEGSAGEETASACSATFLGRESGGGGWGRSVVSVAWRTSRGPMWTRVLVGADEAAEDFSRPAGTVVTPVGSHHASSELNGNGMTVSASPSNGHGTPKSSKSKGKKLATRHGAVASGGKDTATAGWSCVPVIAAADGGRLLVHSGGEMNARLAIWDASYGVLLEDGAAPEVASESGGGGGGASPSSPSGRDGRAVGMKVSGDGAHLALAVAGRVLICPIPVKAAGTLASLLRRKRTSFAEAGSLCVVGSRPAFPSVDLARSAPAWKLLERTGTPEAGKWEATVVTPFREAEAEVVRSLEDAACRKDGDAFERIVREHLQQQQVAASMGAGKSAGGEVAGDGRKKRRRGGGGRDGEECSARIVAAAVDLCLANPDAKLWGALSVLITSGGVSARHHRGLVLAIVDHASPELLEEVMLHVPDLPEADAVRILRHFVSQAATLVEDSKNPNPAAAGAASTSASVVMLVPEVPNQASGGAPPAKRARGGSGGGAVSAGGVLPPAEVAQGNAGGGGIVVSVLKSPLKKHGAIHKNKGGSGGGGGDEKTATKKSETTTISIGGAKDGGHRHTNGNGKAMTTITGTSLSNGHSAAPDDRGTSSDGGCSDGGTQAAATAAGANGTAVASSAALGVKSKRNSEAGPREAVQATTAAAAARAERGVRVALTLPHNEAFLRSALAGLSHGEVVVVLKVLTRLLAEGKTLETGSRPRGKNNVMAAHGLPPTRTDSVVGWACAVLDSHFTRLAIGGSADADLVGAIKALKKATRGEAECCELLCQVRSLVDEVGRRQAAAEAEKDRRRSSRDLFTLRVLTF